MEKFNEELVATTSTVLNTKCLKLETNPLNYVKNEKLD
jgi:hypothetical protein